MKTKYLIREFLGEFEIIIERTETEGMFWWKKDVRVNYRCNIFGNISSLSVIVPAPPMPSFKTQSAAIKMIVMLETGPIYHEVQ